MAKKKEVEVKSAAVAILEPEVKVQEHIVNQAERIVGDAERIAESRKSLLNPLGPGQAYFEAPDGFIIVAEADRPHVLYRQGNGGKGLMINPRR